MPSTGSVTGGFTDLHCHWLPGVDDGAKDLDEARGMLTGLHALGFDLVMATPHMRPGRFDNTREGLAAAFEKTRAALQNEPSLPKLGLSSEHYFDDVVFSRLLEDQALPYPGGRAVLLEFFEIEFPPAVSFRLADLRRRGLLPIVAHPERYPAFGKTPELLARLLDVGAAGLLDIGALVGRYGRQVKRVAETLLEAGHYHAACSDAHRPGDIAAVGAAMARLEKDWGASELEFLLRDGPRELLQGRVPQ